MTRRVELLVTGRITVEIYADNEAAFEEALGSAIPRIKRGEADWGTAGSGWARNVSALRVTVVEIEEEVGDAK